MTTSNDTIVNYFVTTQWFLDQKGPYTVSSEYQILIVVMF